MPSNQANRKLTASEYVQWLTSFVSLLEDMTALTESDSADAKANLLPMFRVAEHVFNFFIAQKSTYQSCVLPEDTSSPDPVLSRAIFDLKLRRDNVADRISRQLESDPKLSERYQKFCDNLKDPRSLGCML